MEYVSFFPFYFSFKQIIMIINSNLIRSMNFKWGNIALLHACLCMKHERGKSPSFHFLLRYFSLSTRHSTRLKDKSWFILMYRTHSYISIWIHSNICVWMDHLMKLQTIYKVWLNWKRRMVPQYTDTHRHTNANSLSTLISIQELRRCWLHECWKDIKTNNLWFWLGGNVRNFHCDL